MSEMQQSEGNSQNTDASQTAAATQATDTAAQGAGTTETQAPQEGSTLLSGDKPAEAAQPQGAPEKYEFKAPEGSTLNEATMADFSTVARELNLTNEAAQKLIDHMAPKIAQQNAEAFQKQLTEARTAWQTSVKADKEFGGDKLTENLSVAKKALDAFGSPELRTLLETTGLGDNPEIIRAFYRAGKAMSEDKPVPASQPAPGTVKDLATALYGTP